MKSDERLARRTAGSGPRHIDRRERLREELRTDGLDALLVTDLLNIRYLTGFTGSAAALWVAAGDGPDETDTVLCTDGRYRTQAAAQVPDLRAVIDRRYGAALVALAASGRAGFESHVVTVDGFDRLAEAAGDVELVRAPNRVEKLREVKDESEILLLERACAAADTALSALIETGGIRPGRTEREVARELESLMAEHGADGPSFETIVAAGPNSAIPHHRPTGAVLARGDFVKIDFGALVAGYHSDMTRTLVLGAVAPWQQEIYDVVLAAQAAGREALAPGASLKDVDAAARDIITVAGYGENFGHGLGHGVGLQIHEAPGIGSTATGTLLAGSTVTVEPGVYLPDRGGVRIEDTLVVRPDGPELLTRFPKELTVID
ncbi:M24 family metallopeptidase [Mycobacteroides franklinii]|uniref:Putative peptidase n=1 Tax=Mycobacteroides franklinii TaxID=948102 RepID=A0A4R8QZP0_9MYCO|nr:Xaa-Pro peptidase family protein [Mycobacteroides franklinii]TDZ45533.1 putative peptidase [Mycobacteroides franklinii]TDZ49024.1 putative peptidase [Mycobacteroides franklinii]TDZ59205.1 putative peptidase [Mycobacteroides franklinii]TDZ66719.1 putative peptidase [Mycobacteroides franklinii]TDZ72642.1 putative peptidase [Mycobacteroides franklinii]